MGTTGHQHLHCREFIKLYRANAMSYNVKNNAVCQHVSFNCIHAYLSLHWHHLCQWCVNVPCGIPPSLASLYWTGTQQCKKCTWGNSYTVYLCTVITYTKNTHTHTHTKGKAGSLAAAPAQWSWPSEAPGCLAWARIRHYEPVLSCWQIYPGEG